MVPLKNIAADDRPVNAYDDCELVNDPVEFGGRGILLGVVKSFVDDDDKCLCCGGSCRTGNGGIEGVAVSCWSGIASSGVTVCNVY